MRSLPLRSTSAAALLAAGIAGTLLLPSSAAFADSLDISFHDGGCGHHCRAHGGFETLWPARIEHRGYVDLLPPPPVFVTRHVYVDALPLPVTPVYVDVPHDPRLGAMLDQISADTRALDAERASGVVTDAGYWQLKGQADAIRSEIKSLERSDRSVSGRVTAALQGEVSRLTRAIDRLG